MPDTKLSKADVCNAISRSERSELVVEVLSTICKDPDAHITEQFPGMPTHVGLSTYSRRARLNSLRKTGIEGFEDLIVGLIKTHESKIDIIEILTGHGQHCDVFLGSTSRDLVGVLKFAFISNTRPDLDGARDNDRVTWEP